MELSRCGDDYTNAHTKRSRTWNRRGQRNALPGRQYRIVGGFVLVNRLKSNHTACLHTLKSEKSECARRWENNKSKFAEKCRIDWSFRCHWHGNLEDTHRIHIWPQLLVSLRCIHPHSHHQLSAWMWKNSHTARRQMRVCTLGMRDLPNTAPGQWQWPQAPDHGIFRARGDTTGKEKKAQFFY